MNGRKRYFGVQGMKYKVSYLWILTVTVVSSQKSQQKNIYHFLGLGRKTNPREHFSKVLENKIGSRGLTRVFTL